MAFVVRDIRGMARDPQALHNIIDALRALADQAKSAGYPTVKSVLSMAAGAVLAIAREAERDGKGQVVSLAAKDGVRPAVDGGGGS